MPSRVPAVLAHPSVARAAVGPSAVGLTAAGVGIGVLDHSLPLAVALAVAGWGARMACALVGRARRHRSLTPERVDPWSVPPPWREQLQASVDAQARFDQAVASLPEGPARDRVTPLIDSIDRSVRIAAVTARRGALLTAPERAVRVAALSAELTELAGSHSERNQAVARHETVVATQLRAMRRAEAVSSEALDQVRLLATRIDDAVTALVELSMDRADVDLQDRQPGSLLTVLDEIEALRAGIEANASALDSMPAEPALPPANPDGRAATPDAPATS